MLYFMKSLPDDKIDISGWNHFIKNQCFRNHFIYFVYLLQGVLFIFSIIFGVWHFSNAFIKVCLFIGTYFIHELLHIIVIYKLGDISITHSGIFLWITSGVILSKLRFFMFMSLPFMALTAIPAIVSVFIPIEAKNIAIYVAWINLIISGSDIINSILIAIKPNNSLFYRGYYKIKSNLSNKDG